jgi:hypothetical protein
MSDFGSEQSQVPPQVIEKPTSITVFGVLNIIGCYRLIYFFLVFFKMVPTYIGLFFSIAGLSYLFLVCIVSVVFPIWLIILGIGLLKMKSWARRGSIVYACVRIIWFFIAWGISIIMIFLDWMNLPKGGWGLFFLGFAVGSIGLIYPILLLIFMKTTKVKQAFSSIGG